MSGEAGREKGTIMKANFDARYYTEAGTFTDPESPSRYGVNCMRVEPHPVKGALIIATEGHVLGVWHDEQGECSEPVMIRYDESLNALCGLVDNEWQSAKRRRMQVNDDGTVTILDGFATIAVIHGLISTADFPEWRNVLPKEETPRMDINPKYMEIFGKLNTLHFSRVTVWISPSTNQVTHANPVPAVVKVDGREDFTGIVMGMTPADGQWPGTFFDSLREPAALAAISAEKE